MFRDRKRRYPNLYTLCSLPTRTVHLRALLRYYAYGHQSLLRYVKAQKLQVFWYLSACARCSLGKYISGCPGTTTTDPKLCTGTRSIRASDYWFLLACATCPAGNYIASCPGTGASDTRTCTRKWLAWIVCWQSTACDACPSGAYISSPCTGKTTSDTRVCTRMCL